MATKPRVTKQERDWRAQEALSTLTRAEQIRTDTRLMADVRKYAQSQVKTLSKVASAPRKAPARKK